MLKDNQRAAKFFLLSNVLYAITVSMPSGFDSEITLQIFVVFLFFGFSVILLSVLANVATGRIWGLTSGAGYSFRLLCYFSGVAIAVSGILSFSLVSTNIAAGMLLREYPENLQLFGVVNFSQNAIKVLVEVVSILFFLLFTYRYYRFLLHYYKPASRILFCLTTIIAYIAVMIPAFIISLVVFNVFGFDIEFVLWAVEDVFRQY